jgi:hypothetical protein
MRVFIYNAKEEIINHVWGCLGICETTCKKWSHSSGKKFLCAMTLGARVLGAWVCLEDGYLPGTPCHHSDCRTESPPLCHAKVRTWRRWMSGPLENMPCSSCHPYLGPGHHSAAQHSCPGSHDKTTPQASGSISPSSKPFPVSSSQTRKKRVSTWMDRPPPQSALFLQASGLGLGPPYHSPNLPDIWSVVSLEAGRRPQ